MAAVEYWFSVYFLEKQLFQIGVELSSTPYNIPTDINPSIKTPTIKR